MICDKGCEDYKDCPYDHDLKQCMAWAVGDILIEDLDDLEWLEDGRHKRRE